MGRNGVLYGLTGVLALVCSMSAAAEALPLSCSLPDAQPQIDAARAAWNAADQDWLKQDVTAARAQESAAHDALEAASAIYRNAGLPKHDNPALVREYAALCALAGDYDLAAEALKPLFEAAPDDGSLWLAYGYNLARVGPGPRQEAFDALRKAAQLLGDQPAAAEAHRELARLYWEEGLYDFSREACDRAKALGLDTPEFRIETAAHLTRTGEMDAAWNVIQGLREEALRYDVEMRARFSEALADFDAMRRDFADTAVEHAAYARLLYQAGRISEAIMAARHAARLNPNDAAVWKFLGDVQSQLGNADQARQSYEKSLEVNPNQPELRQRIEQMTPKQP